MAEKPNPQAGAEEAIVAVLRAEREAQEAVARCAAEAAALVAEARRRAAEVGARGERRIERLRAKLQAALEQRIESLQGEPRDGEAQDPAGEARFGRAAAALVRELTGASS